MFKDITLIIPTHYRHTYLDRVLDYYSDQDIKILVCDSSKSEYPNKNNFKNITYFHYPDYGYSQKMFLVTKNLSTKYTILCADDNFVPPNAIKKCIEFLEKNNDYASVQGHSTAFLKHKEEIIFYPTHSVSVGWKVDDNSPSERIKKSLRPYMHLIYSVHRTENIQKTFELAASASIPVTFLLIERLVGMVAIINGKHIVLPLLFTVADVLIRKTYRGEDIIIIATAKRYKKKYDTFIDHCSGYLAKKEGIDYNRAKNIILQSMKGHLDWCQKGSALRSFIYYKLPFGGFFKLVYQYAINPLMYQLNKLIKKQAIVKAMKKTNGLPVEDQQEKAELKRIEYFIKKHNKTRINPDIKTAFKG